MKHFLQVFPTLDANVSWFHYPSNCKLKQLSSFRLFKLYSVYASIHAHTLIQHVLTFDIHLIQVEYYYMHNAYLVQKVNKLKRELLTLVTSLLEFASSVKGCFWPFIMNLGISAWIPRSWRRGIASLNPWSTIKMSSSLIHFWMSSAFVLMIWFSMDESF